MFDPLNTRLPTIVDAKVILTSNVSPIETRSIAKLRRSRLISQGPRILECFV